MWGGDPCGRPQGDVIPCPGTRFHRGILSHAQEQDSTSPQTKFKEQNSCEQSSSPGPVARRDWRYRMSRARSQLATRCAYACTPRASIAPTCCSVPEATLLPRAHPRTFQDSSLQARLILLEPWYEHG